MAKGRKPALKAIEGGLARVPSPPDWLPVHAAAEWRRVMPHLTERRVLTDADMGTVESYCLAMGQIRQCQAELAAAPSPWIESAEGAPRPHPAFRVMHTAQTQARQLANELGLTPVARQRLGTADDGDDDLAALDL